MANQYIAGDQILTVAEGSRRVHDAQSVLSKGIALFGSPTKQARSLDLVFFDASPLSIEKSEASLRICEIAFGCAAIPFGGLSIILRKARNPVFVEQSKIGFYFGAIGSISLARSPVQLAIAKSNYEREPEFIRRRKLS